MSLLTTTIVAEQKGEKMVKGDVVQFTEKHKWCGGFGTIYEVKRTKDDVIYMIGVPIPMQGMAYIRSLESKHEFEYIGRAVLVTK